MDVRHVKPLRQTFSTGTSPAATNSTFTTTPLGGKAGLWNVQTVVNLLIVNHDYIVCVQLVVERFGSSVIISRQNGSLHRIWE